jgi:hypothetical protein
MNQDNIHFCCGRCDMAAGKLPRTISDTQAVQTRLEEFHKMWIDLGKRNNVEQEHLEEMVKKFSEEMINVQEAMCKD